MDKWEGGHFSRRWIGVMRMENIADVRQRFVRVWEGGHCMNIFWRCCWAVSIEVNIFHRRMNSGRWGGRGGQRGGMDIGRKRRGQASFMVTYSQVITTAGNFPDGGRGCNFLVGLGFCRMM